MFIALFLFVFALILLLAIYDRVKYRRIYKLLGKFPGPTCIPLIGVAFQLRSLDFILESFSENFCLYGSTFAAWIFRVPIVVISDPKHLKIVLNSESCLDKEKRYQLISEVFGNGLLLAPVKLWKKNRKIINPTFNQKILDSFFDIFAKHAEVMVERMEMDIPENKIFNVDDFVLYHTTNMIMETAMGIDDDEIPRPPSLYDDLHRMSEIVIQRTFKVWLHPDFIFRLSPSGREYKKCLHKLNSFLMKILEKRYDEYHNHKNNNELIFDNNKRKPFLEHLISTNEFTIQELMYEVAVFLTAGSDTTAVAVGYVLVCLGALKDIQNKVVEEIHEVFGDSNRPICIEDLPKLQYLERVIKETLRMYPVAPFFARTVTDDIDVEDYIIPKDASIIIPVMVTHKNEKYWPNPLKFDPDRFLPSEVAKRHPYSYIPFSGGPRNCIGKQYGLMSVKIILAYIVRKFKIDTNIKLENMRFNVQIATRILGGANISIEKRNKL